MGLPTCLAPSLNGPVAPSSGSAQAVPDSMHQPVIYNVKSAETVVVDDHLAVATGDGGRPLRTSTHAEDLERGRHRDS